jgi:hypothetical protein
MKDSFRLSAVAAALYTPLQFHLGKSTFIGGCFGAKTMPLPCIAANRY